MPPNDTTPPPPLLVPVHAEACMLPQPATEYLTQTALAVWLDLDPRTVRRLLEAGRLPAGRLRPLEKRRFWTREDAAVAKWLVENSQRFGADSGESPGKHG